MTAAASVCPILPTVTVYNDQLIQSSIHKAMNIIFLSEKMRTLSKDTLSELKALFAKMKECIRKIVASEILIFLIELAHDAGWTNKIKSACLNLLDACPKAASVLDCNGLLPLHHLCMPRDNR